MISRRPLRLRQEHPLHPLSDPLSDCRSDRPSDPDPSFHAARDATSHHLHSALERARRGEMSAMDLIATAEALTTNHAADAALDLYGMWIDHNASHPVLYAVLFNYGVGLADAGRLEEAADIYRRAAAAKADFLAPHINLGTVLERLGAREEAVRQWLLAAHAPTNVTADTLTWKVTAWKQIGRVLEAAHCEEPAENALRQSLELQPAQPDAIQHWIALRQAQCRWPIVQSFGSLSRGQLMRAMSPLSLAAYADDPVLQLANAHRSYLQEVEQAAGHAVTVGSWPAPQGESPRRLRVGYLSSDLRDHAIGFLTAGLYALHDRSRVEVFAYYTGPTGSDETQARIRAGVDHWTDIAAMTDQQAASRIVADKIDILLDMNGYTRDARTRLLALRPAPIIVNWLGFPGTMGTPHHHYIIADRHIIPPEHEIYYSEKVLRLPCYQPTDAHRIVASETPTRAECGLPDGAMVYCCFNGANKITRAVFDRWLAILARVPDSVLWLLATNDETSGRLRAHAEAAGIGAQRIVFAARRNNPEHLARYRLADLFLDTTPYGAHTTASDALWMGVPVVTFMGESFPARVCGSLLHAASLPDLVCRDAEHYQRTAIRIGQDAQLRNALRTILRYRRDDCVLFDTALLARHLEELFADMWNDYCAGRLPVPALANLKLYHEIGCEPDREQAGWHGGAGLAAWYRARLAYRDAVSPVAADALLWEPASRALAA